MLQKSTRTPSRPRPTYHHGDLRATLIRAGIDLVSRYGIRGFTMAQAAKTAAVAASAPYRHFEDKDALLAAIAEEGFTRLAARFAAIDAGEDRLERLSVAYVDFAVEHPHHFRVMFEGQLDKSLFPDLKKAGDRAFAALVQEAAALAGPTSGAAARATAMATIWALVHGFALIAIEGGFAALEGGLPNEELLRLALKRVTRSM